jgi:hypothetical protein
MGFDFEYIHIYWFTELLVQWKRNLCIRDLVIHLLNLYFMENEELAMIIEKSYGTLRQIFLFKFGSRFQNLYLQFLRFLTSLENYNSKLVSK